VLGEEDERTLVNLLTDQIEFADVVVLNKVTDAGPERTEAARKIIKALNPDARLIETDFRAVVPARRSSTPGCSTSTGAPASAVGQGALRLCRPCARDRGIRDVRPSSTGRGGRFIPSGPCGAERRPARRDPRQGAFLDRHAAELGGGVQPCRGMSSVTPLGGWWISVPRERWPKDPRRWWRSVMERWLEPWGDRRQEIVFIGSGMDEAAIEAMLDAALVPAWEFVPEAWAGLPDPFPAWGRKAAA
jgi:G3E family GTPase